MSQKIEFIFISTFLHRGGFHKCTGGSLFPSCFSSLEISSVKPKGVFINNLSKEFTEANVILINEGQFFKDIVPWVKKAVDTYKKTIYICGLDGDFKRVQFNNWLGELIPFCDKITKLTSICGDCKSKPAIFSHRISDEQEQEVIGNDNYIPLCRNCYNTRN